MTNGKQLTYERTDFKNLYDVLLQMSTPFWHRDIGKGIVTHNHFVKYNLANRL